MTAKLERNSILGQNGQETIKALVVNRDHCVVTSMAHRSTYRPSRFLPKNLSRFLPSSSALAAAARHAICYCILAVFRE